MVSKIDDISNIKIIRQFFDIDILLVLNMKDGEQYFLIIENKTVSDLGDQQLKTIIYYTKLAYNLKYNKDKFSRFEIDTNIDNVERYICYCMVDHIIIEICSSTKSNANIFINTYYLLDYISI